MSVLITGGTGFIGSCVARKLVDKGEQVVIYDLYPNSEVIRDFAERVRVIRGDVLDPVKLMATIKEHNVQHIVHLAFLLAKACGENPSLAIRVNLEGTDNVFKAARISGTMRVVYASSAAVYGPSSYYSRQPIDEDAPMKPGNMYGAFKSFNDLLSQHYRSAYGADILGLRPTWVYGSGVSGGLVNNLIRYPAMGKPFPLPDHWRKAKMDWIYLEDAADAFIQACYVEKPKHGIFNLGSGELRSIDEAVAYVKQLIPDAVYEEAESAVKISDQAQIDISRLRNELKFEPRGLKDGIADVVARIQPSKT